MDNEVLTIKEIDERYPNEWVLIADPVLRKDLSVARGRVAFHGADRDEMYRTAADLKLKNSASHYTGRVTEKMALNL